MPKTQVGGILILTLSVESLTPGIPVSYIGEMSIKEFIERLGRKVIVFSNQEAFLS
jgi:hypothetical protein